MLIEADRGFTKAFHYTKLICATEILRDGVIRRSFGFNGESPAVWFSTNDRFEYGSGVHVSNPKTGEMRELSFDQLTRKVGLVRFHTDADALVPFEQFRARGVMEDYAVDFNKRYIGQYGGDITQWRISLVDFPMSKVTGADVYLDDWEPMTPESLEEMGRRLPRVVGATWHDVFGKRRSPKKRKRKR